MDWGQRGGFFLDARFRTVRMALVFEKKMAMKFSPQTERAQRIEDA